MSDYSVSKARRSALASFLIKKYFNANSPCRGDCPDRNAVCHGNCKREADFQVEYAKFRERIVDEIRKENMMDDYYQARNARNSAAKGDK